MRPTAMPPWTRSTRVLPVRVSTSTSLTCTAAEKPRPTWMPFIVTGTARRPRSPPRLAVADAPSGPSARSVPMRPRRLVAASTAVDHSETVVRLPPEAGPCGRRRCGRGRAGRRPSVGSTPKTPATARASTVRLPVPMSCDRGRGDETPALDGDDDLAVGVDEVHPVRRGDTDAAAVAARLAARRRALLPRRQRRRPAVERLALRVAVPLRPQRRSGRGRSGGRPRRRSARAPRRSSGRRGPGRARRAARSSRRRRHGPGAACGRRRASRGPRRCCRRRRRRGCRCRR